MTTPNVPEKVKCLLASRTTEQLCDDFILEGILFDNCSPKKNAEKWNHLVTVRGWLLDEIERRNPEGFDRWVDSPDMVYDKAIKDYVL